jgi:hypothetical protein
MELSITISPRKVLVTLVVVILGLVVASTAAGGFWYVFDPGDAFFPFVQLFWVDSELNVPTLFSVLLLLAAAGLLAVIAIAGRRDRAPYTRHWGALAAIFAVLGFDEGTSIHERTVEPVRMLLEGMSVPTGRFIDEGPAWVVLGAVVVIGFVAAYARFLLHLPARIRNLMVLSGATFVTGALGIEILSHMYALEHSQETAVYALLATFEEGLEMLGIALFTYTLLLHLHLKADRIDVRVLAR